MSIKALTGTWSLTHRAETESEVEFIGEETDPTGVPRWLEGSGRDLLAEATPCEGLTLIVSAEGEVKESTTGAATFPWFDAEGVLEDKALPFDGHLVLLGDAIRLLLPGETGPLRYDDGDTMIADRFELDGNRLLRSVSVVTDELYLSRHLFVYAR